MKRFHREGPNVAAVKKVKVKDFFWCKTSAKATNSKPVFLRRTCHSAFYSPFTAPTRLWKNVDASAFSKNMCSVKYDGALEYCINSVYLNWLLKDENRKKTRRGRRKEEKEEKNLL